MRKPIHAGDTRGPTLAASQAAGFPVGGETLAVDLANTRVTVTEPATDLLVDRAASDRFWRLHEGELPAGWATPSLEETRRIRDAIRAVLDAVQRGAGPDGADLDAINAASEAAPVSLRLDVRGGLPNALERWHAGAASDLPLAAAARSAIAGLADAAQRAALRRCANPACSMLFVTGDGRRRWCTPNICGNRDRAARHYRRHRNERA